MKLSSKARYAIEAMLELAVNPRRPVTLASISVHQGISQSYMEQLFMHLRKAGLIQGARGPGGGYRLGRDAADITVADVVVAVDDRAGPEHDSDARRGEGGPARVLWDDLSRQIFDFLGNITLAQLVENSDVSEDVRHAGHEQRAA
ncbi:HTH-type transcriptional regulator IscR [Gammaproteobacteria bacterium]